MRSVSPLECPICSGRQISYEHSLAFLYPEVSHQWHPTKNLPLTPEMVFPFSDKLVWWICNGVPSSLRDEDVSLLDGERKRPEGCGNEWQETVVNRVDKWKNNGTLCRRKRGLTSSLSAVLARFATARDETDVDARFEAGADEEAEEAARGGGKE